MNLRGTWVHGSASESVLGCSSCSFSVSPSRWFGFRSSHLTSLPSCGSQEKAAITQFTRYGGREAGKDLDIYGYGDELNWPPLQAPPPGRTLQEFAASQASPKQVVEYYEKKLTEHGWETAVERYPADGEGPADYSVVGNRDGLRYDVYSFALEPDYEPADIRVNVYKP
jgi:hypothetical protein